MSLLTPIEGARRILTVCAGLAPDENLLILFDAGTPQAVVAAFAAAGRELNPETVLMEIPYPNPGGDPPATVSAAMRAAHVVVAPTSYTVFHTRATLEACAAGARVVTVTGATEVTITSPALLADFEALEPVADWLEGVLTAGGQVRLTTPGGTDLRASIAGRRAVANTCLARRPGQRTGVPTVEAYVAPIEGTATGVVVIDGSTSVTGLVDQPIRITVKAGRAVEITGGRAAAQLADLLARSGAESSYNLAEVALGLNPAARVVGSIIEDEGALGTAHVALGRNVSFHGSTEAPVHIDCVMWHPELAVDGKVVEIPDLQAYRRGAGAITRRPP